MAYSFLNLFNLQQDFFFNFTPKIKQNYIFYENLEEKNFRDVFVFQPFTNYYPDILS